MFLPLPREDLTAFLMKIQRKTQALTHEPCEMLLVLDYDGMPFGISYGNLFGERTSI